MIDPIHATFSVDRTQAARRVAAAESARRQRDSRGSQAAGKDRRRLRDENDEADESREDSGRTDTYA